MRRAPAASCPPVLVLVLGAGAACGVAAAGVACAAAWHKPACVAHQASWGCSENNIASMLMLLLPNALRSASCCLGLLCSHSFLECKAPFQLHFVC